MIDYKVRNILWNSALYIRGNTLRNLKQLERWQRLNENETKILQQKQLKNLLSHAFTNVPYYREVLGGIFDNHSINLEHFNKIPLLDKSMIRSRFDDLKSKLLDKRHYYNSSGGSTGEPIILIQDYQYKEWGLAVKKLFDQWTGYYSGMPQILLWGSERDLFYGKDALKTRIGRWLRNEIWLNTLRITPNQQQEYINRINQHKPVQILAYVECAYDLALHLEQTGQPIHSPQAVMVSAGTLYPPMRSTIERVFNAPVFNRYGSREVGDIACECNEHGGLHISAPTHYIEILRPDGSPAPPGETGEIVVTLLTNYSMPLIRYRIGDMGSWSEEPCPCGRKWPSLKKVTGKISDTFIKKDGTFLSGMVFEFLFLHKDWLKRFQIVQEDYDFFRLFIIPCNQRNKNYHDEVTLIMEKIQCILGPECRVQVEFVDEIPPTPSGKYRYMYSKIYDHHLAKVGFKR